MDAESSSACGCVLSLTVPLHSVRDGCDSTESSDLSDSESTGSGSGLGGYGLGGAWAGPAVDAKKEEGSDGENGSDGDKQVGVESSTDAEVRDEVGQDSEAVEMESLDGAGLHDDSGIHLCDAEQVRCYYFAGLRQRLSSLVSAGCIAC